MPTMPADQNPAQDPAPVIERNSGGASPILFTCDHYGRLIPDSLNNLGVADSELDRHIAWDIGIAGVAERLSAALNAHLIAQRYSRLVIDCNRPHHAPGSIPLISEATLIPGNDGLTDEAVAARRTGIFAPYHDRIGEVLDQRAKAGRPTLLISLHSFTPVYAGIKRPWHVGTLYQHDKILAPRLLAALRAEGDLVAGDNEPYAVGNDTDYTIPFHGDRRGLPNTGIEIRQDLIQDEAGQIAWAERLARIFAEIAATLEPGAFAKQALAAGLPA